MIKTRGYAGIGLYYPQKMVNIGQALRACGCYDASFIAIEGHKYTKHASDTTKEYRHTPLFHIGSLRDIIPYDCVTIAVDILDGAKPLSEFCHPERAFYIFGPENGPLGEKVLSYCQHKIYIPTKYCMNLAATINVVLYDRMISASR